MRYVPAASLASGRVAVLTGSCDLNWSSHAADWSVGPAGVYALGDSPGTITIVDAPDRNVLLCGVVGSVAYGLATDTSDIDRLGVYLADTRDLLGLTGPTVTGRSVVTTDPDTTLHELGKFTALALKSNPTVIELLWLPEYETVSPGGAQLISARSAFLSTDAVRRAYGGYATTQLRRLTGRADEPSTWHRTEKHARHAMRMLSMGTTLLATGELQIDLSGSRDDLFRLGKLAVSDRRAFMGVFADRLATFDAVASVLPDSPDIHSIERMLVETRLGDLASRGSA